MPFNSNRRSSMKVPDSPMTCLLGVLLLCLIVDYICKMLAILAVIWLVSVVIDTKNQ